MAIQTVEHASQREFFQLLDSFIIHAKPTQLHEEDLGAFKRDVFYFFRQDLRCFLHNDCLEPLDAFLLEGRDDLHAVHILQPNARRFHYRDCTLPEKEHIESCTLLLLYNIAACARDYGLGWIEAFAGRMIDEQQMDEVSSQIQSIDLEGHFSCP